MIVVVRMCLPKPLSFERYGTFDFSFLEVIFIAPTFPFVSIVIPKSKKVFYTTSLIGRYDNFDIFLLTLALIMVG